MEAPPLQRSPSLLPISDPRSVTRERVHLRTLELALIAGRTPPHVTQADYEQAKREITGEADLERQEAMLSSSPG